MQKALLERLFGSGLALRPADLLAPRAGKLKEFVRGAGLTMKLYTQSIRWQEQQDGTLAVDDGFDSGMRQFEATVERHTRALLGLAR